MAWKQGRTAPGEGGGVTRGNVPYRGGIGGMLTWGNKGKVVEEGARDRKGGFDGKLFQFELQERSRKGLCVKSGEKWGANHICKFKHF